MSDDLVRDFGYLTLGSRLKRIGERLQGDAQAIFKVLDIEVAPALMPTLRAIARSGELTVGGLAEALGVAQPGVTRNIAQLEEAGLVRTLKTGSDRRVRTLALTRKGEDLVARSISDLDPWISSAVAEICDGLQGPLLDQLAALEEALDKAPLVRRGTRARKGEDT